MCERHVRGQMWDVPKCCCEARLPSRGRAKGRVYGPLERKGSVRFRKPQAALFFSKVHTRFGISLNRGLAQVEKRHRVDVDR